MVSSEKPPATTAKPSAITEKPPTTTEKPPATSEKPPVTTEKSPTTTVVEPVTTNALLLKIIQSLDEILATQKVIAASVSRPVWERTSRSQPLLGNEHSVERPVIVKKTATPLSKTAQKVEPHK